MATSSNGHGPTIDFVAAMGPAARKLLGDPKSRTHGGAVWRYGSQGSLEVNVTEGWWHDYESETKGGTLDLIRRERRCDNREAIRWLGEMGLSGDQPFASRQRQPVFYDYRDETGTVLYRVERRKPATPAFLPHGPDGRGGFHSASGCMQGVRRVPYLLPELLAADPRQIVFFCEGEKDAERLAELGFISTTNASGAGKVGPELAQHFAGRRVVALQDNDDAGRRHVEAVAQQLGSVAAVAPLLLDGLPPKGDVSDWLDAGGTPERLHLLAERALAGPVEDILPLADLLSWADREPEPQRWLLEGFIPEGEVTLLTGAGGVNKSTFGQQLATAYASRKPMLGVPTCGDGGALYVTAEDGWDRLHWVQAHITRALGIAIASLAGKLELASLRGRVDNLLATFDGEGRLHLAPMYLLLKATIRRCGAKLVVLDNVGHLFAGNENNRGQVTAWLNALYAICVELQVTVVLIAHPNKAGDSYSGSTAWLNAVRSQLVMKRPENAVDPDTRLLTVGKANYSRQGVELAFRWHEFALTRDVDMPSELLAEISATAAASGDNAAFLACLAERNRQRREVSDKSGPSYAPAQFEDMREANGADRARMKAVMTRLFGLGRIERAVLRRDTSKGRDIIGLREVNSDASPNDPQTHPQTPETGFPNGPQTPPERAPNDPRTYPQTPPLPKGREGGTWEAPLPPLDREVTSC